MKKIAFIPLFACLFFFSCERKSDNKSDNLTEAGAESVTKEIDVLKDSVEIAWKTMISTDDQKFQDIKRLLDEISYTNDYDVAQHDALLKELERVKSQRYDESLNLEALDRYDVLTDSLIRQVYMLKSKSKEIVQHPLADQLVEDINHLNSQEIMVAQRMNYDRWASSYNEYLKKHRKKLEKKGEPYASLKERPRFLEN